jgi:DNA-binding NarL/FixJ family response regulator
LGEYPEALPLLWQDYATCLSAESNNAYNTLQRIALIYLQQQKIDSALQLARLAYNKLVTSAIKNNEYVRNASKALSDIFRVLGPADSTFFYADIYHHLNDSLNRAIASNRADVAMAKLDFEKTTNKIQLLQQERAAEKLRRNLLLAALLLLLAAGWFYFRWQKQQHDARQQKLLHSQQMAETEIANARKQLEEYTQHIIEKNHLIEGMQQQLQQQNIQLNEDLLNQTILTENDWLRFKAMFEKAQPGFITYLQQAAPGITTAEVRLATLIRLNLGNKHIAAMLGIGADAVRKTCSRLRQRLMINNGAEMETYLKQIADEIK